MAKCIIDADGLLKCNVCFDSENELSNHLLTTVDRWGKETLI